jgi:hypothetical protein
LRADAARFGGDPNRIVRIGHSAGATIYMLCSAIIWPWKEDAMASERKTSGWVVSIGVLAVALMGAFYISVGSEWYTEGHLRLCLPSDINGDGWCKQVIDRGIKEEEEAKQAAEAELARRCIPNQVTDTQDHHPSASDDEETQIKVATDKLLRGTVDNTCSIRGWNGFFGNTPIDHAFRHLFEVLYRSVSEALNPWFSDVVVPNWNAYFASDEPSAAFRRTALAFLAAAVFAAVLGLAVKNAFDWLHEIFLAGGR